MKEYEIAIIGGGITGLSAAYYLTQEGRNVVVIEKSKDLGGLVSSWDMGEYKIEKYYHHISMNDKFFINFLDELGLGDRMEWKLASVGYYYEGKVYKMDTPLDILKFKGLNIIDIFRIVLVMLRVKIKRNFSDLDNISAKEWLVENGGERVYNNFFKPLLKSKFGKNLDEVSAAWLFGRIKFRSRRSYSGEKLGYMTNGFYEFVDRLEKKIVENGGEILTESEVSKIEIGEEYLLNINPSNKKIKAKKIVSTIPPQQLLKTCKFPSKFEELLKKIKYQRTICALFGLTEKILDEIYWLNIKSEDLPFGAIIEHTNFHQIPEYKGDNIIYAVTYVQDENDKLWKKSNEDIIATFIDGLESTFKNFKKDSIKWWKLSKGVYTSPIYRKGYFKQINEITSPAEGFYVTGMFMTYPERSMNGSLKLGYEIAMKI